MMDAQTSHTVLNSSSLRLESQSIKSSTRHIPNGSGYLYSLSKIFLVINLIILPGIAHATTVKVTVNQDISSETANINDSINAVADSGGKINCVLVDVERTGMAGDGGKLQFQCLPYPRVFTVRGTEKRISYGRVVWRGASAVRDKGQPALITKGQKFTIEE